MKLFVMWKGYTSLIIIFLKILTCTVVLDMIFNPPIIQ